MFQKLTVEEKIEILPHHLRNNNPENAIKNIINQKYSQKVILEKGYVICVMDILKLKEAKTEFGKIYQKIKFQLCTFKPKINTVMIGKIIKQDFKRGLTISLKFFSNVYIPPSALQENSYFDKEKNCWFWKNTSLSSLEYGTGELVRFRVTSVYYNHSFDDKPNLLNKENVDLQLMNPQERQMNENEYKKRKYKRMKEEEELEKKKAPDMYVIGTLDKDSQDGLGCLNWINS